MHIGAYLELLGRRFPNISGLLHPNKFALPDIQFNPDGWETCDAVFVVHVTNHWLCLTNINPNSHGVWLIYDSLCTADTNFCDLKPVFAKLRPYLKESKLPFIVETVTLPLVQRQFGSNDCGLFALAYAQTLCELKDPGKHMYNQLMMRYGFNECMKDSECWPFMRVEVANADISYQRHAVDLE